MVRWNLCWWNTKKCISSLRELPNNLYLVVLQLIRIAEFINSIDGDRGCRSPSVWALWTLAFFTSVTRQPLTFQYGYMLHKHWDRLITKPFSSTTTKLIRKLGSTLGHTKTAVQNMFFSAFITDKVSNKQQHWHAFIKFILYNKASQSVSQLNSTSRHLKRCPRRINQILHFCIQVSQNRKKKCRGLMKEFQTLVPEHLS